MRSSSIIVLGLLALFGLGCQEQRSVRTTSSPTAQVQGNLGAQRVPAIPAELKPALTALRKGETSKADGLMRSHIAVLENWLSKVLIKGRTTQDDVVTLLGPHLEDLDRPQRDGIVTKQYFLGTMEAFTTLVFDFDAKTGKLSDWSTSQGICGFCPHVFADDGHWRLEGKLLAGCIGSDLEGTDSLLLPRLVARDGQVQIKVANLAPEIEFLDQIELGSVPLKENENLDVGYDGRPFVWRPEREQNVVLEPAGEQPGEFAVNRLPRSSNAVVVLELRNTSAFETAMREFVFGGHRRPAATEIRIQFDEGTSVRINPVGTKFLRRVVVPVPADAGRLQLHARPEMWLVRRMWIGTGRPVDAAMRWATPGTVRGPPSTALRLISQTDQQRLRLEPMQEVEITFPVPISNSDPARLGYVLRMTGYYEFQRRPELE
jgi:hypothetical protein